MRKIMISALALLCCVAMVFSFAACDNSGKDNGNGGGSDVFSMTYGGTKIELGVKADSVLNKLGEANSVKELGDCGGFGAQVKYTYSDIELYTLKTDDGETVDQISFTSDLVSTSKGISLGDTASAVTDAYGEPTKQSDTEIMYTSGNMTLKFKLSDGKVAAIDYIRVTK